LKSAASALVRFWSPIEAMASRTLAAVLVVLASCVLLGAAGEANQVKKKHHHKHHHKHHSKSLAKTAGKTAVKFGSSTVGKVAENAVTALSAAKTAKEPKDEKKQASKKEDVAEKDITKKMKTLEAELAKKEKSTSGGVMKGSIEVNGPLPADFAERFAQSVAQATGCDPSEVKVIDTNAVALLQSSAGPVVEVVFEAPADVVKAVENQAADPDSKLANGSLRSFLVAKDGGAEETPVQEKGIDVDTEMPYGELEPFGREDTAQELTEQSVRESDEMVDQLERAEVAEEKRAVFRALTRLRGAAITSYDGIARAQTGNIDEYNKTHKWRKTHPLHHLADEESDISKWAFPDNADFL